MAVSYAFAVLLLVAGKYAVCPVGSIRGSSALSCYKLYGRPSNWLDAKATCKRDRGHLHYELRAANDFLVTLTRNYESAVDFWAGATRRHGEWSWLDRSLWIVDNWAANHPILGSDCLSFSAADGKWYSADCNKSQSFICEVPDSEDHPPTEPCLADWIYFEETDRCYQASNDTSSFSWNEGSALCAKLQGSLVSIPNFGVNYRILGTLWDQTLNNNQDFVVIGYRRNATTHTWHWVNGAPTTFTLWHNGNPQTIEGSNSLCGGRADCDCAIMVTAYPGIGDWQNVRCDEQWGAVICERESFAWRPNAAKIV